jgi:AraC-like DNA-binding protein
MTFNLVEELGIFETIHLITPALSFAIGPSIYIFTYQLVFQPKKLNYSIILHFIPVVFALPFTKYVQTVLAFGTFSQVTYAALSFPLIRRYHLATKALRSDAEEISLNWLIISLSVLGVLLVLDVIRLNLQTHLSYNLMNTWYFAHLAMILILFTFLILKALQRTSDFKELGYYETHLLGVDKPVSANDSFKEKNTLTKITPQKENTIGEGVASENSAFYPLFEVLNNTIVSEQLYLKPRLSLRNLSDLLSINEKEISAAINHVAQKNFNDYINGLRIKFAVEKLRKNYQGTILELALSNGYNAKSTFNTAFKKHVGMTPTQYLSSIQTVVVN